MATRTLSVTVIRPEDLLLLRLDFVDVDFTPPAAGSPAIIQGRPGARLIVHFQPQHVAEEAFWETAILKPTGQGQEPGQPPSPPPDPVVPIASPPPPGQVGSRIAGPTRLAFTIPASENFLLTLEGILGALKRLPLAVTRVASYQPPGCIAGVSRALGLAIALPPPQIVQPNRFETAIELPYRLILSPDDQATWDHALKPVKRDGLTELWHTRLGSKRANKDPRVRAVWSPDFMRFPQPHVHTPFRSSLTSRDRNEIVQLTSNYYLGTFLPAPVSTERMMLTTLGAWLTVEGRWNPPLIPIDPGETPRSLTVQQWRHIATMGRDHFVKVVYAGFLFPFGHRASLIKITERKFIFTDTPKPGFVAYNLQKMFLQVKEHVRTYTQRDALFNRVEITTEFTPDLEDPKLTEVITNATQEAFWPALPGGKGHEFLFDIVATEWEGRRIKIKAPLIFVSLDKDVNPAEIKKVVDAYKAIPIPLPPAESLRSRAVQGQPIAFAPSLLSGDTTHDTSSIAFDAELLLGSPSAQPHFRPMMAAADVSIPAMKNLLGDGKLARIEWEKTYTGTDGNKIGNAGNVYARVTNKPALNFGATDKAGGLAAPNIGISALSRSLGPVGGPLDVPGPGKDMITGELNPAAVFGAVKLLGGLTLSDLIQPLTFDNAASAGAKLPKFRTLQAGNIIRTSYEWTLVKAELKTSDAFIPKDSSRFTLNALVEKDVDPNKPPVQTTSGEITDFSVVLLPSEKLVTLHFKSISFKQQTGKKLDTSAEIDGIEFLGILDFVNALQDVIPSSGFKDPPSVELVQSPPGVNVGFSIGIPTIGVGVMTMQNISLSAGFFLPFLGDPLNFRFSFCKREQPFILTVALFGGGGFFALDMGLDKVKSIEASLEFGASIVLDLGVASGGVTIMAGFYFKTGPGFTLTGYFRAVGSMEVLGIISVSVEFYLGLTFESKGTGTVHDGKLWGEARLTLKISIAFFSISVGVSMQKEFAGSDPTFRQLMAFDDWKDYCGAFADYPAVVGE